MIEVFKTNVQNQQEANRLIDEIHQAFIGYTANFDLEDCDRILRVQCETGLVQPFLLIRLLKDFGFQAEVLADFQLTG